MTNKTCACYWSVDSDEIVFCSLHEAAGEMKTLLALIIGLPDDFALGDVNTGLNDTLKGLALRLLARMHIYPAALRQDGGTEP